MSEKYRELKVIMFAKKKSQKDLAALLNMSEPTVNSKINGKKGNDFTITEAEKISELLDITEPANIFFKPELRGTQNNASLI